MHAAVVLTERVSEGRKTTMAPSGPSSWFSCCRGEPRL